MTVTRTTTDVPHPRPTTAPAAAAASAAAAPAAPAGATPGPRLPEPRGELGRAVDAVLRSAYADHLDLSDPADLPTGDGPDASQTLWVLQELHYRGFAGVDDRWEWHPQLLAIRVRLEQRLEAVLRERWEQARPDLAALGRTSGAGSTGDSGDIGDVAMALFDMVELHDGPSVGAHLHRDGTREQALDMLKQKSVYHLKEADPTAWVVPRLLARAKAPLAEIQYDEYGAGDPAALHHHLYERAMQAAGLDADYGAYVGEALPQVLEQNTAMSTFGLHRRLRGAALGHFAAFEASSSLPSARLSRALRGLGLPEAVAAYYDEHVEADAAHEQIAVRAVCGGLLVDEPHLAEDVLFGAWTCLDLDARVSAALLDRWAA